MPDLRFDPLGRREVLLAPERAKRGAPPFEATPPDPAPCDFCEQQEARTPPETFSIRHDGSAPDTAGWTVRVVPNLYPATPFHEVVVHSPQHYEHFEDQDEAHQLDVMQTYRARLGAAPTAANVIVWNRGRASGASRTHAHGQIFGLESLPTTLQRERDAFADDPCVLCAIASESELVVASSGECRVVAHPVPFVAGELLLVPACKPRLDDRSDTELRDVASAFTTAITGTLTMLGSGVPFNLVVHTAPRGVDTFHWHAHLMPRTAIWGGLEMGAELPIVAADPHETAAALRSII